MGSVSYDHSTYDVNKGSAYVDIPADEHVDVLALVISGWALFQCAVSHWLFVSPSADVAADAAAAMAGETAFGVNDSGRDKDGASCFTGLVYVCVVLMATWENTRHDRIHQDANRCHHYHDSAKNKI